MSLSSLSADSPIQVYSLVADHNKYRLHIAKEYGMHLKDFYKPLRILSFAVLVLMLVATLYAFTMTGLHWTGINV